MDDKGIAYQDEYKLNDKFLDWPRNILCFVIQLSHLY